MGTILVGLQHNVQGCAEETVAVKHVLKAAAGQHPVDTKLDLEGDAKPHVRTVKRAESITWMDHEVWPLHMLL